MKVVKMLVAATAVSLLGISTVMAGSWLDDTSKDLATASSNLYVDVSAGVTKWQGQTEVYNASVGAHDGWALTTFDKSAILGLQLGGELGTVETEPGHRGVYEAETGLFTRGVPAAYGQTAAAAVLLVYGHDQYGSNLLSLRPLIGMTLDAKNSIGGKGSVHLNYDDNKRAPDSGAAFWVHKWNDKFSTEGTVGYRSLDGGAGSSKGVFWGPTAAYSINNNWDLAASLENDNHGDYTAFLQLTYGFGGKGVHSVLDNVAGTDATPFPVR